MTERRGQPPPAPEATDQQIAEALQSLLRKPNAFNSVNDVVQELESKLGLDLGHRVDFIRAHIQHIVRLHTQPQNFVPQPHHYHHQQNDRFALHQTPNFYPPPPQNFAPAQPGYGFRPPPPPQLAPQPQGPAPPAQVVVVKKTSGNVASGSAKESAPTKKRRGGPGGLNKLCGVSPELQPIVGQPTLPRTEIVKQLWAYIRKNNLQDPNNRRKIICNDELRVVFETDSTDMFKMNKLLAKHIIPLEPTKQTAPKKPKIDVVESGSRSDDPVPIVIISEELASFFGTEEREMSQPEVLRQMWEYIKVNQLEDPLNPTAILCDAKLQELLGCESISALGIPEILARRCLCKKS